MFLLVAGVKCSLAGAPGSDEQAEVGGADNAIAVDVGTVNDRPIGIPGGDQKPEVRGIDFAILVKIPRAWERKRFAVVA